jgi:hypothetical protein
MAKMTDNDRLMARAADAGRVLRERSLQAQRDASELVYINLLLDSRNVPRFSGTGGIAYTTTERVRVALDIANGAHESNE